MDDLEDLRQRRANERFARDMQAARQRQRVVQEQRAQKLRAVAELRECLLSLALRANNQLALLNDTKAALARAIEAYHALDA
jgi:hypothetical protein